MNILLVCCGISSDALSCFRQHAGPDNVLIAAATDLWATGIYDADKWHLLRDGSDEALTERILELCRMESVGCVVPLTARFLRVLTENQERFHRDSIATILSAEALEQHLGSQPELHEAYHSCFAEKRPPFVWRIYKAFTKLLPQELKTNVSLLPEYLTTFRKNKRIIRGADRQIVYLLDTPTHDNLGDHAIAYAQQRFIEKALPDAQIVELPILLVDMHLPFIRKHIRPGDLFCMIGGGNFGDKYLMHEYSKRKVCRMFPDNRVIIFPQTISYADTPEGRRELALTQEALRPHGKLTITARDQISHRRAEAWFPEAACILTPDIVLSLDPVKADVSRNGILCCLRRDLERSDAVWAGDVLTRLAGAGYRFTLSDTAGEGRVSVQDRPTALQRKWQEFCGAELVITDRLHGMIFSCITATPCIVLDNYNHKIRDFYRTWLKEIPYIRFAETVEEILPLARELKALGPCTWDNAMLAENYAPLLNALRKDLPHE